MRQHQDITQLACGLQDRTAGTGRLALEARQQVEVLSRHGAALHLSLPGADLPLAVGAEVHEVLEADLAQELDRQLAARDSAQELPAEVDVVHARSEGKVSFIEVAAEDDFVTKGQNKKAGSRRPAAGSGERSTD